MTSSVLAGLKLMSAITADRIMLAEVSKYTNICLLISCVSPVLDLQKKQEYYSTEIRCCFQKSNIGDLQPRSWKKTGQQDYRAGKKTPEVRKN